MNAFNTYTAKNKLKYIFKKAWKLGFSHPDMLENKAQMLYRVIQQECFQNNSIELLNVQSSLINIFAFWNKLGSAGVSQSSSPLKSHSKPFTNSTLSPAIMQSSPALGVYLFVW